jgi:hypothetical protein
VRCHATVPLNSIILIHRHSGSIRRKDTGSSCRTTTRAMYSSIRRVSRSKDSVHSMKINVLNSELRQTKMGRRRQWMSYRRCKYSIIYRGKVLYAVDPKSLNHTLYLGLFVFIQDCRTEIYLTVFATAAELARIESVRGMQTLATNITSPFSAESTCEILLILVGWTRKRTIYSQSTLPFVLAIIYRAHHHSRQISHPLARSHLCARCMSASNVNITSDGLWSISLSPLSFSSVPPRS